MKYSCLCPFRIMVVRPSMVSGTWFFCFASGGVFLVFGGSCFERPFRFSDEGATANAWNFEDTVFVSLRVDGFVLVRWLRKDLLALKTVLMLYRLPNLFVLSDNPLMYGMFRVVICVSSLFVVFCFFYVPLFCL